MFMDAQWSIPVSYDEMIRRAGMRRHINEVRRLLAEQRRVAICLRCLALGWPRHGIQKRVALEFRVSEATVSRAVRKVIASVALSERGKA